MAEKFPGKTKAVGLTTRNSESIPGGISIPGQPVNEACCSPQAIQRRFGRKRSPGRLHSIGWLFIPLTMHLDSGWTSLGAGWFRSTIASDIHSIHNLIHKVIVGAENTALGQFPLHIAPVHTHYAS